MATPNPPPERVTVSRLTHETTSVLKLVEAGKRIGITRNGKLIGIISPPDPDEVWLDELAAAGHVRQDWREGQTRLRALLRSLPARATSTGLSGSAAILADREESGDR
ncbi:type II toxin-antitoxin system Phd/YefM family antitoxin [Allokutzneria sp. NRRL B-24872]|uniref:type II toxin-antitoxin system Phd/YefM family antitoxin n=1 Tax=Allokutzneria sp. NRRL B-24872 TaxID=1137961 RepID=UPI001178B036|nr:hypothetical protein [Allokutzneria sp. NRRL B-24872]